jgi:dihydroorotate dehydrogenase electron transfer subunit
MPTQPSGIFSTRVIQRRTLCREHFEVWIACENFPDARPGQFVQVLCRDPASSSIDQTLLRRPFSIAGLHEEGIHTHIALIGRTVGPGTRWLDNLRVGDPVSILGPLGRAFSIPAANSKSILIAGGVGLPPIRWLAQSLRGNNQLCECIYGAQTRDLIPLHINKEPEKSGEFGPFSEEFTSIGAPIAITTDDGSCGMRGRVTDCFAKYLARHGADNLCVFGCGPEPMLKAIAQMCMQHRIPCELAMERVMGCGMATCQSCVVPVRDQRCEDGWRYALCCTEGPVFSADDVIW